MDVLPAFLVLVALMGVMFVWVVRRATRQHQAWAQQMRSTPSAPPLPMRPLPYMTEEDETERWEDLRRRLEELK